MLERLTVPQALDRLKALVATSGTHTEAECGNVLVEEFAAVLLPLEEAVVLVDKQYTTESGRVDVVLVADRTTLDGSVERVAYVWELKAPQVTIFERDTASRVRPSPELYSAENQLLHYHSSLAGSDEFRARWRLGRREDVVIGGIVIGTQATFVASSDEDRPRLSGLARTALGVRDRAFYRACGLRLLTWDQVIQRGPLLTESHMRISS
jgi:hypothetical protein